MFIKKDNLFINPQGIGDLAIPLKYFIINFIKKSQYKNDFIIQYQAQKKIIEKYNKSKANFFFSSIFYKLNFLNLKKIFLLKRIKYNYLYIDPNISISKAIFLSLVLNAKTKIYKKFLLHKIFFTESPEYIHKERKKYYQRINKKFFKNEKYLIFKKKKNKKKILGIAPGTGNLELHRRWDHDNFSKLINSQYKKFDIVYIFGNEKKLLNQISSKINFKYKIISYKNINLSLDKLLEVKMLITNDNGIANFAANFGIKCNIICGPSIPYPIQNYQNVNIISKKLDCSPCYRKNRYGCGKPICLSLLTPSYVEKKLI